MEPTFVLPDCKQVFLLFEELNMCRAVGQLKVCVAGFKVSFFCVAKGKYSKAPEDYTLSRAL